MIKIVVSQSACLRLAFLRHRSPASLGSSIWAATPFLKNGVHFRFTNENEVRDKRQEMIFRLLLSPEHNVLETTIEL